MSLLPFNPAPGYARVRVVKSFNELVTTPFANGVNALCWHRTLTGDFNEIVEHLTSSDDDIETLDEAVLNALPLSPAGKTALETLVADLQGLRALGISPVLNCIHRYPRDEKEGVVPTDVYSYHADSATVETDTYLCSYTEAASEGLRNEESQRLVDIPAIRANLLKRFGGEDNDDFLEYLRDHAYDLHYAPLPNAQPFSFGLGNLWRIAVKYPVCPVPPCVHRAPETLSGRPPRLLLIS